MNYNYLKIYNSRLSSIIYFTSNITREFNSYSNNTKYYDYYVEIKDMILYNHHNDEDFGEEFGGIFLYLDNDNSIRMYDTVKKEEIDLENNEDCMSIYYIYNDKTYITIDNLMKDFLYNTFILS